MSASCPTVERFAARLASLSHAELLEVAAQGCHESAVVRRETDALLAIRTPVPDWAVNQVLLSPDLVPHIFASLEVENHAAALACKAWGVGWKARSARFRILRAAPCPAPDFELTNPLALAALPGGERMAVASHWQQAGRVHIVDKEMKLQHTIGDEPSGVTFSDMYGLAYSDDGLYVAESRPARVRRFVLNSGQPDTFAVAAEHTGDERMFDELALAPGGVLFVGAENRDRECELLALDALSLKVRFRVGEDVLGGDLSGLAVCGDEVYVGRRDDEGSIRVFSLSGKPLRVISSQPGGWCLGWRQPHALYCVGDRLYLIEVREVDDEEEGGANCLTGRRIYVLTPEGRTLQVYYAEAGKGLHHVAPGLAGMCHFDGKLMVTDFVQDYVFALHGA